MDQDSGLLSKRTRFLKDACLIQLLYDRQHAMFLEKMKEKILSESRVDEHKGIPEPFEFSNTTKSPL